MLGSNRTFVGRTRVTIGRAFGRLFGVEGGFGIIGACVDGMLGNGRFTIGRARDMAGFGDDGGLGIIGSRIV